MSLRLAGGLGTHPKKCRRLHIGTSFDSASAGEPFFGLAPTQKKAKPRVASMTHWTPDQLRGFLASLIGDRLHALWLDKVAWFKDPEGNILALAQRTEA